MKFKHRIRKIIRYEFWPFWIFYFPFVPFWLWKSLLSKSFIYFCKANPGIRWGGFMDYSKYDVLMQLDENFRPKTKLIRNKKELQNFEFPFVAKPDKGERGVGVELILSEKQWRNFEVSAPHIIQEFVDYPLEFGVFYIRNPKEKTGKITSVTGKEFLLFMGDGKTSLKQFIQQNHRAFYRKNYLLEKHKNDLNLVLEKGEKMLLEPIGNHNRGTKFIDASHFITKELSAKIDLLSKQIKGFYYGRFDVKAKSVQDFQKGEFKVLEVNGSNSEPTHIYDPKYSLLLAYREVYKHLNLQYKIALANKNIKRKNENLMNFIKALYDKLF